MSADIEPPRAPRHRCVNAECGCTDLVSAGPCSAWCAEHTVEVAELEHRHVLRSCECGHATCVTAMPRRTGFVPSSERGMA